MQLTPQQRQQVEQQHRVNPQARGVRITLTAEQREEQRRHRALVEAGREEDLAYWQTIEAAAEEPGFSGDLRQAILESERSSAELASEVDTTADVIDRFRLGHDELPYAVMARIVTALRLRLTASVAAP